MERLDTLNVEAKRGLCPTVTPVLWLANAIDYVCAQGNKAGHDMKPKKVDDDETKALEKIPDDVASDDDTQRVPTLSVQEIERLLKDKKGEK